MTRRIGVLAAIALAAAGCAHAANHTANHAPTTQPVTATSQPSTAAPPPPTRLLSLGQIGTRDDIPWPAVGVGWTLALATTHDRRTEDLMLVAPAGGAYQITTVSAGEGMRIIGHSGDGLRALLGPSSGAKPGVPTAIVEVDLHSGTARAFTLSPGTAPLQYTNPDGSAILASTTPAGGPSAIERLDLDGHVQKVLDPDALPGALMTVDGTGTVLNHVIDQTHAQLRLVGNDGHVIRNLPMPKGAVTCIPAKWLATNRIVVHCTTPHSPADRLWLLPTDGNGTPAAGPPQPDGKGPDYGDLNTWWVTTGQRYFTARGACGGDIIVRQTSAGRTTQVFVPHQPDRNEILGVDVEDRLLVESSREAGRSCAVPAGFVWFDPVIDRTTPFATRLPAGAVRIVDASMWKSADDAY